MTNKRKKPTHNSKEEQHMNVNNGKSNSCSKLRRKKLTFLCRAQYRRKTQTVNKSLNNISSQNIESSLFDIFFDKLKTSKKFEHLFQNSDFLKLFTSFSKNGKIPKRISLLQDLYNIMRIENFQSNFFCSKIHRDSISNLKTTLKRLDSKLNWDSFSSIKYSFALLANVSGLLEPKIIEDKREKLRMKYVEVLKFQENFLRKIEEEIYKELLNIKKEKNIIKEKKISGILLAAFIDLKDNKYSQELIQTKEFIVNAEDFKVLVVDSICADLKIRSKRRENLIKRYLTKEKWQSENFLKKGGKLTWLASRWFEQKLKSSVLSNNLKFPAKNFLIGKNILFSYYSFTINFSIGIFELNHAKEKNIENLKDYFLKNIEKNKQDLVQQAFEREYLELDFFFLLIGKYEFYKRKYEF